MSNLVKSQPQLVWVIEPENKIRFRYESEGGSHGGLAGKAGDKTYPTLKLVNYHGRKQVVVRVSLYTEDEKEHVFEFKGKKCEGKRSYIEEKVQEDKQVVFKNLQILSKKKDEVEDLLMERKLNNLKDGMSAAARAQFEKTYKKDVKGRAKAILNSVRLHFEAYEAGRSVPICTLFSDVIWNQKNSAKGDLRIIRLSRFSGSCKGGDEVFLLCEKVQKESIKVKFYETGKDGSIIWEAYGHFSQADVHYQVAIVFQTPPYRMDAEKQVYICLERNGEMSEPREFHYKPEATIPSSKKRKLSNHQPEAALSPENGESSESVSSMSISSPESVNNGQCTSNSQSEDSSCFNVDDGILNAEEMNFVYSQLRDVPNQCTSNSQSEDLSWFNGILNDFYHNAVEVGPSAIDEILYSEDDLFAPDKKEQNSYIRHVTGFPADSMCDGVVHGQMADPIKADGQMVLFGELGQSNAAVGQICVSDVLVKKDYETNQCLDLIDFDPELRNFRSKEVSESESVDSEDDLFAPDKKAQNSNLRLASAEMYVTDFPREMKPNQRSDLIDIDTGLRNFRLKEESESESAKYKKNVYKSFQNQEESRKSKRSEFSPQQKKQICTRLLLKRDNFGNSLLHFAVLQNKNIAPIFKLSQIAKVDIINAGNCKNQTALHLAAEGNRINLIRTLLQNGGNANLRDMNGNNCYHISAQNNFPCVLQEINSFSKFLHKVSDFNDEGLTPMHIAIMQKDSNHLFDMLKIHVTNPNVLDKKAGKSLLHYAVDFQPSLLPKLLEMPHIDVDIQDFEGNTPLHIACVKENIAAVKQLLQSGADPLIKNFKQNSNSLESENSEDDASDGQLPGDLTTNIEILKLLGTATDIDVEEPLNLQKSDTSQGSDEIPCHIMEALCRYLDDEMKWKRLVTYFFDEDVIDSLSLSSSPTKALLDYIKKQEPNGHIEKFKTALEFAQLSEAMKIIEAINFL